MPPGHGFTAVDPWRSGDDPEAAPLLEAADVAVYHQTTKMAAMEDRQGGYGFVLFDVLLSCLCAARPTMF